MSEIVKYTREGKLYDLQILNFFEGGGLEFITRGISNTLWLLNA